MAQLPKNKLPSRRIEVEEILCRLKRGVYIPGLWRYSMTLLPSGQSLKDFIHWLDRQGDITVKDNRAFLVR
ncbi:MAG: hypothetical protein WCO12_01005 [bacterium]